MATLVGSLYTSLTLESSSFIANTKRAATAVEGMERQMNKAFGAAKAAGLAFIGGFAVDKLVDETRRALDYADAISDLSDRTGASTRALQEFRFAAQLSGSSVDDADAAVAKFARTLGLAQQGGKAQLDLFNELGVNIKNADGSYRSLDDVLKSFAEGVSKLPTVQQQNAATLEAMGKSAGSLTALLGQGAEGFDALANEAASYGIVLDEQLLRKAGPVNDQLDRMKMILDAQFASAVVKNADSVLAFAQALIVATSAAGNALRTVSDFRRGFSEILGDSGFISAVLANDQTVLKRGRDARLFDEIMAGELNANGLPGFGAGGRLPGDGPSSAGGGRASSQIKAIADIYGGLSANAVRLGGLDTLQDVLGRDGGVSQGLQDILDNSERFSTTIGEISTIAVDLSNVQIIDPALLDAGQRFGEDLSRNLGQALVLGQSLGDALINSIRAAAAELIASGLLSLLTGGKGGGGGILGSILNVGASFLGGARAGGGPVRAGLSYDVGELGRERFVAPADGMIIPNDMMGGGRQAVEVTVKTEPSPLFVQTVRVASAQAGQAAAADIARRQARPRMAAGRG
jgi:hypothetical protein